MTGERRGWALLLEYDGGPFIGWQRQDGAAGLSVQAVLETAAARLAQGEATPAFSAGRTDSGVHASGQVAMVALPDRYRPEQVRDALNFHMRPHPVVVRQAAAAPADWHPRFSALGRCYRYRILNRPSRPALTLGRAWHVQRPLAIEPMREAAASLLGRHDFSAFRAAACQAKDAWRTLDRLDIAMNGEDLDFIVEARSFLHHQVRNMVGTLALVGAGRWRPERVGEALRSRDRSQAGPTAPPEGLTFMAAIYARPLFDQYSTTITPGAPAPPG